MSATPGLYPSEGYHECKQGQGPKSRQANSPKEAGHKEERELLITETSTSSLGVYNLKKGR